MTTLRWSMVAALLLAVFATGCGDDAGADPTRPRFAVATRLLGAGGIDDATFIVGFTDNLDAGTLDLGSGLEVGGVGTVWGVPGTGELYLTNAEDFTVSKYRFEDGQPRLLDRLSVQLEITVLSAAIMVFDGPERAYILQALTGEGVELDLAAMEIVRSIDLSAALDPMLPTFLSATVVVRDGVLIASTYATDALAETVSPLSRILFFDLADGSLETRDAPCGGLSYHLEVASGDIYFASDPWVAGIHALDEERAPAPCLVRLPAGERDPDPTPIRLNELTGGPTGGLLPSADGSILVRVLDTEQTPLTPDTTGFQLFGAAAWRTRRLDLGTLETTAQPRDPVGGAIVWFEEDGAIYENDTSADFGQTTLLRLRPGEPPTPGLTIPGIPSRVVRLR